MTNNSEPRDPEWAGLFQDLEEAFAAEAERRRKVLERLDDLERRVERLERQNPSERGY